MAYDPLASRLVFTADSTNADAASSAEALIPYIPYPTNPETGVLVKTSLSIVERRSDMRLAGRMICGRTGLPVPILGMTIHPETGKEKGREGWGREERKDKREHQTERQADTYTEMQREKE